MNSIIIILITTCTAPLTFYLSHTLKQGAVRASSLLALAVSLFFYLFPNLLDHYLTTHIPAAVIGASFIGMVSYDRLATNLGLSLAGLLFGVIFLNTSRFFDGYGGALGTTACISVLIVMCIPHLTSKRKLTVGILQLRKQLFRKKK